MAALPETPPIDVDEFLAITEHWRERAELLDGEIVVIPAPSFDHQRVIGRLHLALSGWIEAVAGRGLALFAPLDVRLGPQSVVQPDLLWWETPPLTPAPGVPSPPPDLAVEVLSPSSCRRDVQGKRHLYARASLAELWLVDPESSPDGAHVRGSGSAQDRRIGWQAAGSTDSGVAPRRRKGAHPRCSPPAPTCSVARRSSPSSASSREGSAPSGSPRPGLSPDGRRRPRPATGRQDVRNGFGPGGTTRTADVVGTDASTDLAVLQVGGSHSGLRPLALASDAPAVGDPVLAIGSPYGLERTASEGVPVCHPTGDKRGHPGLGAQPLATGA